MRQATKHSGRVQVNPSRFAEILDGAAPLPNRDAGSLAHHAYAEIKKQILTFQLAPGSLVLAPDLADELAMSVTPVHQALKWLCAERLAHVIPRTGYVIAPIAINDVDEIFDLRLALEPLAADRAVRGAGDRDLVAFRETVYAGPAPGPGHARRRRPSDADRLHLFGEHHDRFHLAVAALSGQQRLVDILRDLLAHSRRFTLIAMGPDGPSAGDELPGGPIGAHAQIAEAVLSRDAEAAVEASAAHVRTQHLRLRAFLASPALPPVAVRAASPSEDV